MDCVICGKDINFQTECVQTMHHQTQQGEIKTNYMHAKCYNESMYQQRQTIEQFKIDK